MAITETRTPYEFLARWDEKTGAFKGAHIQYFDAVLRDGVQIAGAPSKAFGVGEGLAFPLADIMSTLTVDTLALVDSQAAQIAALTTEKTTALSDRDAAQAQVAELLSQIAALQPPVDVNGVPQSVPRRQAKTVMELTPHATHGDLWQAALAAANAIEDHAARIVTVNYLLESLYFEHPKVSQLAMGLLGMTQDQVDALFVAAAKL